MSDQQLTMRDLMNDRRFSDDDIVDEYLVVARTHNGAHEKIMVISSEKNAKTTNMAAFMAEATLSILTDSKRMEQRNSQARVQSMLSQLDDDADSEDNANRVSIFANDESKTEEIKPKDIRHSKFDKFADF